ncbi:DUF5949 family protein [Streptomyces sp. NBC_01707]|nr:MULTISPECIES: DUF5949 family protein [unclassified Streptomyces]MDX2731787.1 DUF5949 family protein [Streptomyces sp. PA03-2a]MDX3767291.1 DUF5949 family protein [Streptomyces sp. AK08-01B]MDX3817279.1 DUF5949 family protein [Streptomyces sp. AK08-01A]
MSSPPGSQHGPTPAVCPPAATLHTIAGGRPTPSTHFSPQVLAGASVRGVHRSCHEVSFDQVKQADNVRSVAVMVPGRPVGEELLPSFAADEQVVMASAHCLLPMRPLG